MTNDGYDFRDHMHESKKMDREEVIKARQFFKKMGVYVKVTREMARRHGCKIIITWWLDTNKGDEKSNARRGWICSQPRRLVRHCCFSSPSVRGGKATRDRARMAVIDIKRAYFHAKARQCVLMEISIQDREEEKEEMIGQLQLSLYGTRDAARRTGQESTRHFWLSWDAKWMRHHRAISCTIGADWR